MKKLIAALTVLAVSTAQAATINVDIANCPGPGDGSVGDPYCSIQTAIDNAVDTDEVVVAEGEYFENINFNGKAITVRSTGPLDPMVVANTIIDGTGFFHVVQCVSGEGLNTVLDGFTITGGNANGVAFLDRVGGGMSNLNSSPTVANCTFIGNSGFNGGGMYNVDSSPIVDGCTFSVNSGGSEGGGMFSIFTSSPTVSNSTFCNNDPDDIAGPFQDGGGNSFLCVAGACCLGDSCVVVLLEESCIAAGGTYQGDNTICEASSCPGSCPADVDGDGEVGINDFLDLLAAWGPCP